VRQIDKMYGTSTHARSSATGQPESESAATERSLLHIQYKNLNSKFEMKRMFGNIVNQEQQRKRHNVQRTTYRANKVMTNPKDSWPPVNRTGLFMNLAPLPAEGSAAASDASSIYFSFEHCKLIIFLLLQIIHPHPSFSFRQQLKATERFRKNSWRVSKVSTAITLLK
jgi:hypothetical protein